MGVSGPLNDGDTKHRQHRRPPNRRRQSLAHKNSQNQRDKDDFDTQHRSSNRNIALLDRQERESQPERKQHCDGQWLPQQRERLHRSAQRPQQ